MKNSWRCLCQLLILILSVVANDSWMMPIAGGMEIPQDISIKVNRTLEQIMNYIQIKNVSIHDLAPINIKDDDTAAVENALEGYRYLETAKGLIDRYFILPSRVESYLKAVVPPPNLVEVCDYVQKIDCNPQSPYRNLDGSCNNLQNPYLGKDSTPYDRFLPAMYVDGLSDPRTHSFFGPTLPEPRVLSQRLHQNGGYLNEDQELTNLASVFGTFLNHDIQKVEALNMKDCCQIQREFQAYSMNFPIYTREGYDTLLSMSRAVKSVCMAIYIPNRDQYFSFYNRKCMQYARSTSTPGLDCKLSARQQRNSNTHFIDGSQIYGSNDATMRTLRTGTKGLMSTYSGTKSGDLPPQDTRGSGKCQLSATNTNNAHCFKAGDTRVNDQPTLTSLHALFVREHNRIAKILAVINPGWIDEKLFQESRKIVIAQIQHIVFNEYLPIMLGENTMNTYGLTLTNTGYTDDYHNTASPAIRGAFASAMDMIMATMSRGTFNANGRSHKLSSTYLDPKIFYQDANAILSIFEGMLEQKSQKFDRLVSDELTNRYQEQIPGEGLDLVANIIQRSRDHGLPVYLAWLMFCGFQTTTEFSSLPFHDEEAKQLLSRMYVSVYDLDLVTAGVMETPIPGSKLGPTFSCIVGLQFQVLKKGDRFWYEHSGIGKFGEKELQEIRQTTFAKLICDNTNVTRIQRNVFLPVSSANPIVNCADLDKLDPCLWGTSTGWGEFSPWTQCVGGVRMRFRSCLFDPDGPCTCEGTPIELERCPSDGTISNILSKQKFEEIKRFLYSAAKQGRIGQKPSLSELTAILQYAVNDVTPRLS